MKWIAAVAVLAVGLAAGASQARVLLEENFRGAPKGAILGGQVVGLPGGVQAWRGTTWGTGTDSATEKSYLEYDVRKVGLKAAEGTIEMTLVRDERWQHESLFAFVGPDGRRVFAFRVHWTNTLSDGPELGFFGRNDATHWYSNRNVGGFEVATNQVPFPHDVARGKAVRLAMTWGGAEGPNLYVDGAKVEALRAEPFPLSDEIAQATKLLVGAEVWDPQPQGSTGVTHSPILDLRLHDVALTAAEVRAGSGIESVAAEKAAYGVAQEIVVTLRGTADRQAFFGVEGVAASVPMVEVDDGVYVGKVAVPKGVSIAPAAVSGTLTNSETGSSITGLGAPIEVDGEAPGGVARLLASAPWGGELEVSWEASASTDVDHYLVYRAEGKPLAAGEPAYAAVKGLKLVDTRVIPGIEYRYAVVPVDRAANEGPMSEVVAAKAIAGDGPKIAAVVVEPAGKPLRPGAVLTVTVTGQSGGQVTADLGALAKGLTLAEQGRTGRYTGSYTVKETDVQPTKSLHLPVAHLTDALGASALAGAELAVVGLDGLNDKTPPAIAKVAHDGWQVAGLSGKLVAGDRVTVTLEGEVGGYASFELSEVAGRVAMKEVTPGVYAGSFQVPWGAQGAAVPLVVYLADDAGNEASVQAERPLAFDTRVRLTVAAKDAILPADKKSQTRLTAKAVNANGKAVEAHELALTLSTTDEYTGVVGGGDVEGRMARMEDDDNVEVRWGGVTDAAGEVGATYTAGFAAKTALLVAKDLNTGSVGAGWLNTYVASTLAIELLPRAQKGVTDRAVLRISADPAKLTADGRSTSRVKVWLNDLAGSPLAGVRVAFALGNGNGRLRVLQGTTDAKGIAEAEYRAGTVIGTVTVTASAADYGVAGDVQILLLSDAPAKIEMAASTKKVVADGRSEVKLGVRVSDIHDNPNENVPVTFTVLTGSARLSSASLMTDPDGQGNVMFVAGTKPGVAIIEARHTSRAPTEDELRRIYGTVFVPRWYERQERDRTTVTEWLVKPGDTVEKGQILATLDTRTGARTLAAPAKGVFVREVKHERDRAELGDTLGYVEIDPDVWKAEYAK